MNWTLFYLILTVFGLIIAYFTFRRDKPILKLIVSDLYWVNDNSLEMELDIANIGYRPTSLKNILFKLDISSYQKEVLFKHIKPKLNTIMGPGETLKFVIKSFYVKDNNKNILIDKKFLDGRLSCYIESINGNRLLRCFELNVIGSKNRPLVIVAR